MKLLVLLTSLFVLGCSSATPAGTVLVEEKFESTEAAESHQAEVKLGDEDPSVLTLSIHTAAEGSGLKLVRVTATVKDSRGWTMSFSGRGEPVNVGTLDKPLMSVPFMFSRHKKGLTGEQSNTGSFAVRADGTVE